MDKITVLDLRTGYESREEVIHQLLFTVASVASLGGGVIKLIHGDAGTLRSVLRRELRELKRASKIICFVHGERVDPSDETVRYVCDKFPIFSTDCDYTTKNAGITFACI